MTELPAAGTPAGTVVVRAAGLRVHGVTVTADGQVPSAGELEAHLGDGVIRLMIAMTLMPDASYREALPRPPGAADRGTARHPRRDTRASVISAHNPETDFRTRTEHSNNNTPGNLETLKVIGVGSSGGAGVDR